MSVPNWTPDGDVDLITTIMDIQYPDLRYLTAGSPAQWLLPWISNTTICDSSASSRRSTTSSPFRSWPTPECFKSTLHSPPGGQRHHLWSGVGNGRRRMAEDAAGRRPAHGPVNLAIPAFMLGLGAAIQAYKPLYDIVDQLTQDKRFIAGVLVVGIAYFGAEFGISGAEKQMNWQAFVQLVSLIFNQAATKLLLYVEAETTADEVADEIPFAGWIMVGVNIALVWRRWRRPSSRWPRRPGTSRTPSRPPSRPT